MTELEHYTPRALVEATPHAPGALPVGAANVRAWVDTYTYAAEFAAAVVDTPFVPDSYRPKIDPRASAEERAAARDVAIATAATAIVYGAGIGFDNPVQALQNVYVVKGRPALYADAMVAVVQAAGHEIWVEDLTDSRAVVCGRRRGGREERAVFTMDQARKAGYANRNDNYGKDPQAMLYARAAGRLCKRIAQAELKGFVTMEEILDGDVEDGIAEAPAMPRTVVRAALEASPPAEAPAAATPAARPRKKAAAARPAAAPTGQQGRPPLPGQDSPAAAATSATRPAPARPSSRPPLPGETGELVSSEQLTAMSTAFTAAGLVDRAECRAYVETVVGHAVTDPAKLTTAEAAAVISALQAPTADGEPVDDAGDGEQGVLDGDEDDGSAES